MKIPRVPITFVIPYIRFGGAELQLISQINYLYDQGHPVSLIVLSRILEFREDLHMPDEQILELKLPSGVLSLSSVWQPFRQMGQIFSFLKTHKTEVVLANLPLSHYIMRLCKLLGKAQGIKFKLLAYHHSLQYAANPLDTAGKKVFNSYNAILANAADDANIFISQACLNDIKAHFPIRNPHVIFNSVPLKQISEEAAAQYVKEHRLPDAKFQLMVGGRLHPSKGHPFFLDVFREFLDKHPHSPEEVYVMFVGGGLEEEALRAQVIALGLQEYVHITGFVPNELVLSFLKLTDVVIIPSVFEGFGNIAIEALMQGAMIISSDAGGLKEIIRHGENGFLFPTLNREALLQHLEAIIIDGRTFNREQLMQDFLDRFTLSRQIEEIMSVIEHTSK